ncbi:MAG: dTMP kinase [Planctomycetota bacterium]
MTAPEANTTGRGKSADTADTSWLPELGGRFLVFDGPDGAGKSTQLRRLVASARTRGVTVCEVREPGGTHVGERIRHALLEHSDEEMSLRCEMLLYMASRAQLVEQRIVPALGRGELVIADRFVSSTLVYQGLAGGLPREEILSAAQIATGGVNPDLTVVFEVDEKTAAARLNPLMDRMESKGADFHARVRQGYREIVAKDPEGYTSVDARGTEDEVWAELLSTLRRRLCDGVSA